MNRIRIDDMDDDVILAEAEASSKELAEVAKAIVESSGNLITRFFLVLVFTTFYIQCLTTIPNRLLNFL